MGRIPSVLLVPLLLLAAGFARAQEPGVLTLKEAREISARQHPRITIAELQYLVAQQDVVITAAGQLPLVTGNVTGVGNTREDNRIAGAGLTTSSAHDRLTTGVTISQLITDFGRTKNLIDSSRLHASAEQCNVVATRAQLLVQVDAAYFAALQAWSVLQVADETVKTRQLILDRVRALAAHKLRSELDVNFAEVSRQEADLLVIQAQNELSAAMAVLSALLGCLQQQDFRLAEEPVPPPLSAALSDLICEALRDRPELGRLRCERDAAWSTAAAEQALRYPTVNALGQVGGNPAHTSQLNDYFAVGGLTMIVPVFDGFRMGARGREAELKARQAQEALRDGEDNISRDVRIAMLNVINAAERLDITARMLEYARRGFDLAQARYDVGTSSIVELSQAQLSYTTAEIGNTSAKYQYLMRRSALDYQLGRIR